MSSSSDASVHSDEKKEKLVEEKKEKVTEEKQIETIHTNERIPGHPAYYEKNGLRTYGDDEDHDHEPPVRLSLLLYQSVLMLINHSDVHTPVVELDCHGFHLDWQPNPRLYLRCVTLSLVIAMALLKIDRWYPTLHLQ